MKGDAVLDDLPVFGICGTKNAGKTTVIEQIVPRLASRGLAVAVAKYCEHRIVLDSPAKDSFRLFQSGADVFLNGPEERFFRSHQSGAADMTYYLKELCTRYDLVLVEGGNNIPIIKVWLTAGKETVPPPGIQGIAEVLSGGTDRPGALLSIIDRWLESRWLKTPVSGCVLIGGRSSRMGTPKHLITKDGKTLLENTAARLNKVSDDVIILGDGAVPGSMKNTRRLPDITGVDGPAAGILSAMRWAPYTSFLVTACDMADLTVEALAWLLSRRRPGTWAVIPTIKGGSHVEPLMAYYDFRARSLLEEVVFRGCYSPSRLAGHPKVMTLSPPDRLRNAWRNYNTPEDFGKH